MRALLRQLRQAADGATEYADAEISTDAITIGSAPNSDIQLLGSAIGAQHALIRRSGGTLDINSRGGARFTVNGTSSASAKLVPGDVIDIDGNRLTVLAPPPGFDAGLSVQRRADVGKSEFESAFRTDLEPKWLSKRRLSWALLLLIALIGFAVPFLTAKMHRAGSSTPSWLVDDTFWSAGPLSPPHAQAAGRKCEACHQQFFVHVRDQDCRECHEKVRDHVPTTRLGQKMLGPPSRCGQCHEEHNSAGGSIVIRDDRLCVECHARSRALFGSLKVQTVAGFSAADHPGFMATLLLPPGEPGEGALDDWHAIRVPLPKGREHSNLKFSHAQHLDGNRVQRTSDSKPLGCVDCHVLNADGEHFAPITMARACSQCHELTFDERAPDRQLPHGKPRDTVLLIEDYYAHRFSDPAAAPIVARRRLPDNPMVDEVCRDSAAVCAGRRASLEITNQFTRRGCVTCHVVRDNGATDIHQRYEVQPVRLIGDYFTDTHFSHRLHLVQKEATGDDACAKCHPARKTTESSTLMMPDIGQCLECHRDSRHGGSGARDRLPLQCSGCHTYHSHS